MAKAEMTKTFWAAFTKKGVIQTHGTPGVDIHPAVYVKKQDAKWHGETNDIRKVKITEIK